MILILLTFLLQWNTVCFLYVWKNINQRKKKRFYIYDFDTELPFPCYAKQYIMEAFHPELQLNEQFQRYILF